MLPWFPGDFMRSTRGWSCTCRGIYRELLDAQWDLGELPEKPDELRDLIHARFDEWSEAWPKCAPKFPIISGRRINKRLETHRHRALELTAKRQKGARITNLQRLAQRRAERTAERAHPSPSPSPSPIRAVERSEALRNSAFALESASSGRPAKARPDWPPVPGLDEAAWEKWFAYRTAIKKPIKAPSADLARRQMAKLGPEAMAAVEHSIGNSYQGLIAPKNNGSRKPPVRAPKTIEELEAEEAARANH
jgi:uncharacterized protein YdaU (DUF1376 family)